MPVMGAPGTASVLEREPKKHSEGQAFGHAPRRAREHMNTPLRVQFRATFVSPEWFWCRLIVAVFSRFKFRLTEACPASP